jgi:hypothetical protein
MFCLFLCVCVYVMTKHGIVFMAFFFFFNIYTSPPCNMYVRA